MLGIFFGFLEVQNKTAARTIAVIAATLRLVIRQQINGTLSTLQLVELPKSLQVSVILLPALVDNRPFILEEGVNFLL